MQSDLRIPRHTDIAARALDIRESAARLADDQAVRQLDRLIANLPDARVTWQLGTLVIDSPSGQTYQVTRGGCSCLNAKKCGKRQCWHVATFELLLDMLDTEADSADMSSDPPAPAPNPLGDEEGDPEPPPEYRAVAPRIVAVRSLVWGAL
jgi:hypothetical protein